MKGLEEKNAQLTRTHHPWGSQAQWQLQRAKLGDCIFRIQRSLKPVHLTGRSPRTCNRWSQKNLTSSLTCLVPSTPPSTHPDAQRGVTTHLRSHRAAAEGRGAQGPTPSLAPAHGGRLSAGSCSQVDVECLRGSTEPGTVTRPAMAPVRRDRYSHIYITVTTYTSKITPDHGKCRVKEINWH